jgi:hypothetical protein
VTLSRLSSSDSTSFSEMPVSIESESFEDKEGSFSTSFSFTEFEVLGLTVGSTVFSTSFSASSFS